MIRLLYGSVGLLAGIALGWWLRAELSPATQVMSPVHEAGSPSIQTPLARQRVDESYATNDSAQYRGFATDNVRKPFSARGFRQLLDQQEYDQAIVYYQQALDSGEVSQVSLKPVLEEYLHACLQQCREGAFVTLVDAWLDSYYEDIPVLLLLAKYQQQQGFAEEAVKVLHMAMTYAYQPSQRELVSGALRRLAKSTDDDLSRQQRWIELLGFYELLEAVELTEPAFLFRQAMLYRLLGEPERSRRMLVALQASDDGLDPQRTQAVNLQLAEMSAEPEPVAANSVPVVRRGDHFLIETTLGDREQVMLVIDTGASITSLSRASFDGLASAGLERTGSRLFNTANGITKGEVYRAASVALGSNRIEGVDIAVLDYEPADGVDGLLGMNVLRNYRFEIDQENALLYLRPR